MKVGTKSVLAGAHCFLIHPLFVAGSWAKLFGFPWDVRLWFSFALHDIGYLGRDNMDGASGEEHVILGARIMGWLFGPEWADECYRHSRYWSQRMGLPVSRLCLADKLAFAITPAWLYIPMARWTGELAEYMERSKERQAGDRNFTGEELILLNSGDPHAWLRGLQSYTLRWVERHQVEFKKDQTIRATALKQSSSARALSSRRWGSQSCRQPLRKWRDVCQILSVISVQPRMWLGVTRRRASWPTQSLAWSGKASAIGRRVEPAMS